MRRVDTKQRQIDSLYPVPLLDHHGDDDLV
jgi:hypothetical protein